MHSSENAEPVCFAGEQPAQLGRSAFVICDLVIKGSHTWPLVCRRNHAGKHVPKLVEQRLTDARWTALVVAGVALLIAVVGAIPALLAGRARFIEVAWISIAASLFVLAWTSIERRE